MSICYDALNGQRSLYCYNIEFRFAGKYQKMHEIIRGFDPIGQRLWIIQFE